MKIVNTPIPKSDVNRYKIIFENNFENNRNFLIIIEFNELKEWIKN